MMSISGTFGRISAAALALGLMGTLASCLESRGGRYDDGPYGRPPGQYPGPGYPGGAPAPGYGQGQRQWTFLGANEVSFRTETDTVRVNEAATWQRLQLTAREGAIELLNVRVHFLNRAAAPYDAPVQRYVLTPENPSVVIELPGEVRRNITHISFTYRNVDARRYQRAKLEVWGS